MLLTVYFICYYYYQKAVMEQLYRGYNTAITIQRSQVQNQWVAQRSTELFIIPRLIKWVPGTQGDLVFKTKLPPCCGSVALWQLSSALSIENDQEVFSFLKFLLSKSARRIRTLNFQEIICNILCKKSLSRRCNVKIWGRLYGMI